MVGIFGGLGTGFERGSGSVLGGSGLLGSGVHGRGGEGVFVNGTTGNLVISRQDEFLVGKGSDASVSRTYNSLATLDDDNNDRWRQSTDRRVFGLTGTLNTAGSTVRRVSGDGTEIVYTWDAAWRNGTGAYVAKDGGGAYDTIVKSGAEWIWSDGDSQVSEKYYDDSAVLGLRGRIKSQANRVGQSLTFGYDGSARLSTQTTSDGSWLRYDYADTTSQNITQVVTGYTDLATATATTLTRTRYGYDGSNRLTTVTVDLTPGDGSVSDGASYVTTYGYDASGRVSSIAQSDGSLVTVGYESSAATARVTSLVETAASGVTRTTGFAYAASGTYSGGTLTTITDPSGQVTRMETDASGNLRKITAPAAYAGAAQQVVQFTYNANGDVTSVIDAANKTTSYADFTVDGLARTVTDTLGNVVTRTFGSIDRTTAAVTVYADGSAYAASSDTAYITNVVLSETRQGMDQTGTAVSLTTRYVYDKYGNLRYSISPEGRVAEQTWANGVVSSEIEYPETLYSTAGTPDEAAMNTWRDALQDRSWIVKKLYEYDARQNLKVDRTYGVSTALGGTSTGEGVAYTNYVYDQAGQLLSTWPDTNNATTYTYDGMGRVKTVSDVNGGTTTYVYNDAATTTTVTYASGYVVTRTWNKAGDLLSETDSGTNTAGGTTSYAYDKLGRVRVRTDAVNATKTYYVYDNAGRKVAEVDNAGFMTEYRYDAVNRLVGTITYKTAISTANLTTLANPDAPIAMNALRPNTPNAQDISSWTVYDSEGRVLQTIAGDGSTAVMSYDAAGRLQKTTAYSNKLSMTAIYSSAPTAVTLPTADAAKDTVARNFYDEDGLLVGTLDGEGYLVGNTYDQAGRLVAKTAFANATSTANRASGSWNALLGDVGTSARDRTSRMVYDGQNLLRYSIDPLGQVTAYSYANQTRLLVRTAVYDAPIGATSDYTFDNVKALVATQEAATTKRASYSLYDTAGRAVYTIDAGGTVTSYAYDTSGRVTRTTRYAARSTTSTPSLSTMDTWAATAASNAANRTTRVWYTERGEVAYTVDAEGFASRNLYDADGRVTGTTVWNDRVTVDDTTTLAGLAALLPAVTAANSVTTYRDYDALGRVVRDTDGLGVQTTYAYLGSTSLMTTRIVADNGTAIEEATDTWTYDASGKVTQNVAAAGATADGGVAVTTTTTYDGKGQVLSTAFVNTSNTRTTSWTYDLEGRVKTVTDAEGGVTTYDYNAFGQVWKTTDANGSATYTWYDNAGRATTTRDAGNYITRTTYNVFGDVASVTRSQTQVFDYTPLIFRMYDVAAGRAPTQSEIDDWSWRMENLYAAYTQPVAEAWPQDDWGTRVNRLEAAFADILNDAGVQSRLGSPATSDAAFIANVYQAAFDRAPTASEVAYWGAKLSNGWTRAGFCTYLCEYYDHRLPAYGTGSDTVDYSPVSSQVYRMYDLLLGRKASASETASWIWRMDNLYAGYVRPSQEGISPLPGDLPWNRLEAAYADILTDPGVQARMGSDDVTFITNLYRFAFGRLPTSEEITIWQGNISSGWTRAGMAMLFAEHRDHRMFQAPVSASLPPAFLAGPSATTSFTYDKMGRVLSSTDAEGNAGHAAVTGESRTESYTYTAFGERKSVTNRLGGVTNYVYDRVGNLVREGVAISTTNYKVADGALVSGSETAKTYAYDARGNRIRMAEGYVATSGSQWVELRTTSWQYDNADRVTQVSHDRESVVSDDFVTTTDVTPTEQYTYDARGNVILTISGGVLSGATAITVDAVRTYAWYDDLGRRTAEARQVEAGKWIYSAHTYDKAGNRLNTKVYETALTTEPTLGGTAPAVPAGAWRETAFTYDKLGRLLTTSVVSTTNNQITSGSWNGSAYASATGNLVSSYQYDADGNVVKATDPNGNVTWSWYDSLNRKVAQLDTGSYLTTWSYDAEGNVAQETRFATKFTGSPSLSAVPVVAANAQTDRTTVFTYDLNGNRLSEKRLGVTAWAVDANGIMSAATLDYSLIRYTYNALGQVVKKEVGVAEGGAATGGIASYVYDKTGRLQTEKRASFLDHTGTTTVTPTTGYVYDALGNLTKTSVTGSGSSPTRITEYYYDDTGGRLLSMKNAEGAIHSYSYDVAGRLKKDAYTRNTTSGSVMEFKGTIYDLAGRVLSQSVWSNGSRLSLTSSKYNSFDQVIEQGQGTDATAATGGMSSGSALYQVKNRYDGAGRLIATNSGDGVWKFFGYDKNGNQTVTITSAGYALTESMTFASVLALTTDATNGAKVNGTYTVYDKRGMAITSVEEGREAVTAASVATTQDVIAQNITTSRTYNAFGEVMSETDARGYTSDYAYNTMGRLLMRQSPLVNTTAENGVITQARPTENYYYDLGGRFIGKRDANNNLNTLVLLNGTGYDDDEALVLKERHADNGIVTYGFDIFGDKRKVTNEVGKVEQFEYDKLGRLKTQIHEQRADGTQLTDNYTYDILGQRLTHWNSQLGNTVLDKTDYDALGRVTSMVDMGGNTTTYNYSWNAPSTATGLTTTGAWIKATTNSAGRTSWLVTNVFNQTVDSQDFGGHNYDYTYDDAGRLSQRTNNLGESVTYTWYNTGLQKKVTSGTKTSDFSYDIAGNRVLEWHRTGSVTNQQAKVKWDALGRMTSFIDTNPSASIAPDSGAPANIQWEYDLVGNIRRMKSVFRHMDEQGILATTDAPPQDYWYRYDSMNRFVTTKGMLSGTSASGATVIGDAARGLANASIKAAVWDPANPYVMTYNKGYDVQYNAAGQRVSTRRLTYQAEQDVGGGTGQTITYYALRDEYYTYSEDGFLKSVNTGVTDSGAENQISYVGLIAEYNRDAMGRVTNYKEYKFNHVNPTSHLAYERTAIFDSGSKITSDTVRSFRTDGEWIANTSYYYDSNGDGTGTYQGGVSTRQKTDNFLGTTKKSTVTSTSTFNWWDGALQNSTNVVTDNVSGTDTNYTSTFTYNSSGFLTSVNIQDGRPRTVTFINDANGQILQRDENDNQPGGDPRELHFYFNGLRVGDISNNGTSDVDYAASIGSHITSGGTGAFREGATSSTNYADFDQSYDPINGLNYQSASSRYTVQAGDTLESISLAVWGDASFWYMIADANGLSASDSLVAGMNITIPNKIHNSHNNSSTYKVYDPNEAIGDTAPTAAKPPKKNKCGIIGQIFLAAIAIAVSVWAPFGGGIIGGVLNGALGSAISQGIGVATGIQDKFSWKGVALSAIGGGVSAGVGQAVGNGAMAGSQILGDVVRGAVSSTITQGIGVATGLQDKFSWSGVAAAGVMAGIGGAVERGLSGGKGHYETSSTADVPKGTWVWDNGSSASFGAQLLSGTASLMAGAATRSAIDGTNFGDNLIAMLPDAVGGVVGRALGKMGAEAIAKAEAAREGMGMGPGWTKDKAGNWTNTAKIRAAVDALTPPSFSDYFAPGTTQLVMGDIQEGGLQYAVNRQRQRIVENLAAQANRSRNPQAERGPYDTANALDGKSKLPIDVGGLAATDFDLWVVSSGIEAAHSAGQIGPHLYAEVQEGLAYNAAKIKAWNAIANQMVMDNILKPAAVPATLAFGTFALPAIADGAAMWAGGSLGPGLFVRASITGVGNSGVGWALAKETGQETTARSRTIDGIVGFGLGLVLPETRMFGLAIGIVNKPVIGVPAGAAASEFIDQTITGSYNPGRIIAKAGSAGLLPYTPAQVGE